MGGHFEYAGLYFTEKASKHLHTTTVQDIAVQSTHGDICIS